MCPVGRSSWRLVDDPLALAVGVQAVCALAIGKQRLAVAGSSPFLYVELLALGVFMLDHAALPLTFPVSSAAAAALAVTGLHLLGPPRRQESGKPTLHTD